ncbi:central kinetochore-associated-domain-containing protein [Mariannaea sp. PMI_226]|nr:central kinetochore-associated-domain-containing protein [Mariannaea sp. PMI_226]
MASPLSHTTDSALNIQTTPTTHRYDSYEVRVVSSHSETTSEFSEGSSPFISTINETTVLEKENTSPSKSRHSRVLSGATLSPLKILGDQMESVESRPSPKAGSFSRTPSRRAAPEKRFPIKVSNPIESTRPIQERTINLEDAVRRGTGLKRAIEIFEDEQSDVEEDGDVTAGTVNITAQTAMEVDESAGLDDTVISTFSTFSAVPSMTTFANLGMSPDKLASLSPQFPSKAESSPSRTPRPMSMHDSGNTTNLLDFTDSLRFPQKTPMGKTASPLRTSTTVSTPPSRQMTNLIDFDIPPMPTPRSVPTITPRELESLKSKFLSEISSLKASLSGKEAEVQSLKAAVGDAEKRVGESMEQLREDRAIKEQLAEEKEGWERRGREMEAVLRKVKEEIVSSQRQQRELEEKLDESEKRREAAEMMHQEAESKMAGMRAGKDFEKSSPEKSRNTNHEVEIAVERVARELHALYKGKHENKVAALKKSYETRWEKRVRELESRIEELYHENERLHAGQDTTMMRAEHAETEELKAQVVRDSAAMKELNADIQRLEAVANTVRHDNEELRGMLERERIEKGELVQLAEEMMNMQSLAVQPTPAKPQPPPQEKQPEAKTPKRNLESLRGSVRGSGLRAPGSNLRAPHERTKSAGGLPRPGGIPRSGIMSSIEKMGSYRGRGGHE